jgi:hypothetical protein
MAMVAVVAALVLISCGHRDAPATVVSQRPAAAGATAADVSAETSPVRSDPASDGAPRFVSGAADLSSATVTLTFDRPVDPGVPKNGLNPMYLVVYGSDPTCAIRAGNAHSYQAGAGTPTITLGQVTSLASGTTYVTIASGLVSGVTGGMANVAQPCTAIPTTGSRPTQPPPTAVPLGAPTLTSAAGDLSAATVTLTFDRPVDPGGPDNSLNPMYLVVYGSDSTCRTPAGNGHAYLSGAGTPTITMGQVTSLVGGTTYITVASGLVRAAGAGKEANRAVACTPIAVQG